MVSRLSARMNFPIFGTAFNSLVLFCEPYNFICVNKGHIIYEHCEFLNEVWNINLLGKVVSNRLQKWKVREI